MRTSAEGAGKLACQWIRGDFVAQCRLLRNGNGDLTGNADEVMGILHDKWMPTFQRYRVVPEPDADAFMLEYASEVDQLCAPTEPLRLPALDASDLSQRLTKMPLEKATGLDGWSVKDLKVLPEVCMHKLAAMLNTIEAVGRWPRTLSKAKVTLIPKANGATDPGSQRPIGVMSTVYRLWASARLRHCADWQASLLPWHTHGFCKGRSVEDGLWQISTRV